jgi:hypothetical protein
MKNEDTIERDIYVDMLLDSSRDNRHTNDKGAFGIQNMSDRLLEDDSLFLGDFRGCVFESIVSTLNF